MKNVIITLLCLLTFSSSYAQDSKPTKQETMDWIVNKFKLYTNGVDQNNSYVTYHYSFVNAVDNKITLLNTSQGNDDGKKWTTEVIIDLSKLTNISTNNSTDKLVESILMTGLEGLIIEGGRKSSSFYLYRKYNSEYDNLILSMLRLDGEPDLYNRLVKALNALAAMNRQNGSNEKY